MRRLEGLVGVAVEAAGLEEESESFERQVSNAVSANPEIQELVQRLEEEQADQLDVDEDIPSGESLARDFEQFLRQRGGGPRRDRRHPSPPRHELGSAALHGKQYSVERHRSRRVPLRPKMRLIWPESA